MKYRMARDGRGVCCKCWRVTRTVIVDKYRNDIDNLLSPEYIRPIEVTECCLSEDIIPMRYAIQCGLCGEWLDIRFAYNKKEGIYYCEACETKEA